MYTTTDLDAAQAELAQLQERWANYSGNNPNKYQADLKAARFRVRTIEDALKANGTIALSKHESLERELDTSFPNAESKEIVEYEGKRYQRRFFPRAKSRSGKTVTDWGRSWEEVKD